MDPPAKDYLSPTSLQLCESTRLGFGQWSMSGSDAYILDVSICSGPLLFSHLTHAAKVLELNCLLLQRGLHRDTNRKIGVLNESMEEQRCYFFPSELL